MTEKTMARRRRYRQRHRRNAIATWVVGAVCAGMTVFLAAAGGMDYANRLPPPENSALPGLALGEAKREAPAPAGQPQKPSGTVYEDGTDWNLRLVNRWNSIPEGYAAELKEVPGGERVDERIYGSLMEMLEAAREGNWDELPRVVSGYRTQEEQQALYDEEVDKHLASGCSEAEAKAEAGKWVALPGTSEHQLGLAVDLEGATYDLFLWLQENSYRYGFVFRYPGGKTDLTGTVEEVWHYRYVGTEAAAEMYERGLCLEEYVGQ